MRSLTIFLIFTSLLISGCSQSSSGSGSSTNVVASTLTALKSAVPDVSDGVTSSATGMFEGITTDDRAALSVHLTRSNIFYPGSSGTDVTPLAFLEAMFSDSTTAPDDAIFKRANMAFLIACVLDSSATAGNALYSTSQTSILMNSSAMSAKCGASTELNNLNGQTISFTIADLGTTTNYDQKITMTAAMGNNNTLFGGVDQYMYVRNNATVLNFLHVETKSADSQAFASFVSYNKSTGEGRFQYASISANVKHLYRIFVDPSANTTSVLTYNATSAKSMRIYARSTAANQTQAAISMTWAGMATTGGASASLTDGNACMNISGTASVVTDDTLTCGTGAPTLPGAASDANTILTAFGLVGAGKVHTDISALTTTNTGAAYAPSFNSTTITSTGLGF